MTDLLSKRKASLKDLERFAFCWCAEMGAGSRLEHHGVPLLELLPVDVSLLLRERWFWQRPISTKSNLARKGRRLLTALHPPTVFRLEAHRALAGHSGVAWGPSVAKPCVLFVVQGATESDYGTLVPLIHKVRSDGLCRALVVTVEPHAAARLQRDGIAFLNMYAFPADLTACSSIVRQALWTFRSSRGASKGAIDSELREAMHRLGILEELARMLMVVMHVLDATMTLLSSVQAVVVASDVHPVGKAVVMLSNQHGVPTIVVQNGLYGDAPEALTVGFLPVTARTVCVWGPGSADILKRDGVSPDRVRITGQPRFDRIVALRSTDWRPWVSAQLKAPVPGPLLVFASQNIFNHEDQLRDLLGTFAEVLHQFPEATLVVKLHPAENFLLWNRAGVNVPRLHIVQDIDLHRLLAASDVVITGFSTSGLEALLLGKPLVILNSLDRTAEMKFVEFQAGLPANARGLAAALRTVLYIDDERARLVSGAKAFIDYYASAADGTATERVVEVIYESAQARSGQETSRRV